MEFSSSRQADLSEEDQMGKVQLHFSFSSSSSSSLHPLTGNPIPWEHQHQMGCCSASAIKCDASEEEEAASTRLDLMDTSPRNNHDDVRSATATTHIQKEHMFDKVVTPSDVGKLNRLVIPKQHAEKFFPLDSSSNEKGLLLNFEDRNGKPWRFRYSYWNSSQSYVMTKGWSRFVKDKKLDAGDIVSFQRGVGELGKDRLYIDWRRRPDAPEPTPAFPLQHHLSFHRPIPAWSPLLMRPQVTGMARERDHSYHLSQTKNYLNRNSYYNGGHGSGSGGVGVINPAACSMGSILYLRSQPAASVVEPQQQVQMGMGLVEWRRQQQHHHHQHPMVFDSVPVVQGKAAAKRLRLFGVNMECPMTESDDECDILSSTTIQHLPTITIQQQPSSSSSQLPPIDFLNKGKAAMSFDHKF